MTAGEGRGPDAAPAVAQRLSIHGLVQGVGFRAAMTREARRLGVVGWVRNRRDGSVEALVAGDAAAVQALVGWARNGPRGARVSRVDAVPEAGEHDFADFGPRPTA